MSIPLKFTKLRYLRKGEHFIGLDGIEKGSLFVKTANNVACVLEGRRRGNSYFLGHRENGLIVDREAERASI